MSQLPVNSGLLVTLEPWSLGCAPVVMWYTFDVRGLQAIVPAPVRIELFGVSALSVSGLVDGSETHALSTLRHRIVVRVWLMCQRIHISK